MEKASIVPYVMPGFMLAKVNEVYSENPDIECLILMNHEFLLSLMIVKKHDLMIKYVSKAEKAVRKLKSKKINKLKKIILNLIHMILRR